MARVVVVGGGYGGVTVAKGLDPLAEVILVEQKDQFVHHAAALRAAVDEAWQHSIFMPYSNLLTHGRVVHGTVSQVEGTRVHIFGQDPIDADYVVLATGSTYPFPAKYSASRSDVAKARLKQLHSYLHGARSVLLVGAGTVGIEFAGELRNAFPDLEITLVEKEPELLPTQGFADELRDQVREQLKELNIRLIEGSELAYLPVSLVVLLLKQRTVIVSKPICGSSAMVLVRTPVMSLVPSFSLQFVQMVLSRWNRRFKSLAKPVSTRSVT